MLSGPWFLATHIQETFSLHFHSHSQFQEFPCVKGKCDWHIFPLLRAAIAVFHLTISLWGSRKSLPGWKRASLLTPCSSTELGPTELCIFYRVSNCLSSFLYSFLFFLFLSFGRHQQMIPWCVVPWAWKNFTYLKTGRPAASYQHPPGLPAKKKSTCCSSDLRKERTHNGCSGCEFPFSRLVVLLGFLSLPWPTYLSLGRRKEKTKAN